MRKRGPQCGSVRIPHPHDQADRIENLGGALEQRRHVAWLEDPTEFGAQMCGGCKVWLRWEAAVRAKAAGSRAAGETRAEGRPAGFAESLARVRGPASRILRARPAVATPVEDERLVRQIGPAGGQLDARVNGALSGSRR